MVENKILKPNAIDPEVRYANWHNSKKNYGWLERTNSDPQLLLCIKGKLSFQYIGEPLHPFEEGMLLFIEPGKQHNLKVLENCTISTFHFEFLRDNAWIRQDYSLKVTPSTITKLPKKKFAAFKFLFEELKNQFNLYSTNRKEELAALGKYILLKAYEYWHEESIIEHDARTKKIIKFIRDNLSKEMDRNVIAKEFHVTPEHLNQIFKKELNCTPTHFINRERCIIASQLIDSGASIKEACYKSGFKDPSYFTKVFKKHLNIKPTQMKRS